MIPEHESGWNWPRFFFCFLLLTFTFCAVGLLFVHLIAPQAERTRETGEAMADRADAPPAAPCQLPTFAVVGGVGCTTQTHHNAVCVACMTGGQCVRFNPYDCPEP